MKMRSAVFYAKIVLFLVNVTETSSSLNCTGVCRDEMNHSVSCSLHKIPDTASSPSVDPCGPSKPVDFKGQVMYPRDQLSAVLTYTWRSPDDSSIDDLVGFQISILFPDRFTITPHEIFRISFDNSSTHRDWSYKLSCTYNKPSINVRVYATCMSMPICNNKYSDSHMTINISTQRPSVSTTYPKTERSTTSTTYPITTSTTYPKTDKNPALTIVAIVVAPLAVVGLTALVWFLRHKVLATRKRRVLDHAREGRQPTDTRYTNGRYQKTTGKTSDIDEYAANSIPNGWNNYRENGQFQRYGCNEEMNFTEHPKDPCPLHGYLPSTAVETSDNYRTYVADAETTGTVVGSYLQNSTHRMHNANTQRMMDIVPDTFRREAIPFRDLSECVSNPKTTIDSQTTTTTGETTRDSQSTTTTDETTRDSQTTTTTGESDDDNCAYTSSNIEEGLLRLNEGSL